MDSISDEDKVKKTESELTIEQALQKQLRHSLVHDGLARGLREVVKSIENGNAKVVILAKDCQSKEYIQLIKALSNSRDTPLIEVEERLKLGEWVGLGKVDEEGRPIKTIGCSSCSIIDWGSEIPARHIIKDEFFES